jgi:Tfp pilus assembly protein PilF
MRIAVVVVMVLAGVRIASAEEPAPEPAVKLFLEGRALLEAGNAADACTKFEESFKLDAKAPGTMLNLGLCHEALGKLATAISWFRRAQTSAAEANLTETEDAAKEKSQALAPKVATIKIQVSAPAGAHVLLDGARVDEVNFGRLEVDAGTHALELVVPNAPAVKKDITVVDGAAITIVLEPAPVLPERHADKKYVLVDVGKGRSNLYLGVGIGLIATSAAVGGIGKLLHDRGETRDDFQAWKHVVRYGGTSLFAIGAAAVTYAVVLRVRAPKKERREVVTPVITRDHVGFALAKPF